MRAARSQFFLSSMGLTTTPLTITNLQNLSKRYTGDFLVDSGAIYTVVPESIWKKLDLKPEYEQQFTLADGKKVSRSVGSAFVTLMNKRIAVPVILGKKNDSALLGVITLEALGLSLDPFERKLYPAHFMM